MVSLDAGFIASQLTAAVSAVCPIISVGIGDPADRNTWTLLFDPSATDAQRVAAQQVLAAFDPTAIAPDGPTLSDWRVGLTLWARMDDVTSKVAALVASTDPTQAMLGKVAKERLEYANNVFRSQLLQLKDAFGFTAADVEESLWRAHQVSLGDLSGVWPLPAKGS